MCSGLMAFFNTPLKNFNIPNLSFRSGAQTPTKISSAGNDRFTTNPLYDRLGDSFSIEMEAKSNPRIQEILKQYNLPLKVNTQELEKLKQGHLKESRLVAAQIYSALPGYLKDEVSLVDLQNAAMLHDYGKVLIPANILNKADKLNEKEREIIEQHAEIGYELLKNKGLSPKTLELIKYHHQNCSKTGYPAVDDNYEHGIDAQILNVADQYTALREKRSYKDSLSKNEALEIIAQEVRAGNVSQDVYTALVRVT